MYWVGRHSLTETRAGASPTPVPGEAGLAKAVEIGFARPMRRAAAIMALSFWLLFAAMPADARDSLGVFERWGAFRDSRVPRCYAIAEPRRAAEDGRWRPFASVSYWPRSGVRGQLHIRLSREIAQNAPVTLTIGERRFVLSGGRADVWAGDKRADAAIIAALRSASSMTVTGRAATGAAFSDIYALPGAATAIDAAALACGRIR